MKNYLLKTVLVIAVLVASVVGFEQVGAFYNWLVPTSTMKGQEVFLVLALMSLHYVSLLSIVIYRVYFMVRRLVSIYKSL